MKRIPLDSAMAPFFNAFIQERVERLVLEAESIPDFLQGKEELVPMRRKAAETMDEDDIDSLVNAARGLDIPIFEYICQAGILDGIKVSGLIKQVKKG